MKSWNVLKFYLIFLRNNEQKVVLNEWLLSSLAYINAEFSHRFILIPLLSLNYINYLMQFLRMLNCLMTATFFSLIFKQWQPAVLNRFPANVLFVYLVKTSKNKRFSNVFMGLWKRKVSQKWINLNLKLTTPWHVNKILVNVPIFHLRKTPENIWLSIVLGRYEIEHRPEMG